ncbi:MAG: TatD family hydrolase [Devosia sp.]
MLVDSHCHLDFPELASERAQVLARAKANDVIGLVTISTRVKRFDEVAAITAHPEVWCSVGTHPHHAHEEPDITADQLVTLAEHPRCVAIGEAGLDYHYDGDYAAQATGFRRHIAAARMSRLPLVIHSRSADADTATILEEETATSGSFPFVLHCFSAGEDLAKRGLALGGYISFSGILTFKNADDIRKVAATAPADRILVETDAPYLAPVPHRSQSNEPAYVRHTAQKLAEVRGVSLAEIGDVTTRNFARLFSKTGLSLG